MHIMLYIYIYTHTRTIERGRGGHKDDVILRPLSCKFPEDKAGKYGISEHFLLAFGIK